MRKLQKPPVGKTKEKKQEPLAEGLQLAVPTDPAGRRLWSKMSDREIVDYARRLMREKKITGKRELEKADSGLYKILRDRELVGVVEFEVKQRSWRGMSDQEVVEIAIRMMARDEIKGKRELQKADNGLYKVLWKRGLLGKVGFVEKQAKRRSWAGMSDDEVIGFAKRVIEEKGINGRGELERTDRGLHCVLGKRGLLDEVGFDEKQKRRRKRRYWDGMSDEKLIEHAIKIVEELRATSRKRMLELDSGLYKVLNKRGLLGKVGFEETNRVKYRSWKDMSDEEVVEYSKMVVERMMITRRSELQRADRGVYDVLKRRKLLGRIFGQVDQQKADEAREAVIDALTAFGSENKIEVA